MPIIQMGHAAGMRALAHPYTEHSGYLPLGADLMNGTMTLDAARTLCNSLPICMGFTLAALKENTRSSHIPKSSKHVVWLKSADEWIGHEKHLTFLKKAPDCPVEIKRYKKAKHGPYCCEGASCPDEDEYVTFEASCHLPAATPHGMPPCKQLRGDALPNVAQIYGQASMSSEYPYSENSGARAGNDGQIDKSLVHTKCEGDPQWWRVTLAEPMMIAQVTLHNRPDFRYRLVGATVEVRHENATVLRRFRVGAGRHLHVMTISPPVHHASEIVVRSPAPNTCLHFAELEAFGAPQHEVDSGKLTFSQVRPAVRPASPPPPARDDSPLSREAVAAAAAASSAMAEAARAAAMAAGAGGAAAGDVDMDEAPPEQPRRATSRASTRAAAGGAGGAARGGGSGGASGGSGGGGGGAASLRELPEEHVYLYAAGAGWVTTLVLASVQSLWIRAHWLNMWR